MVFMGFCKYSAASLIYKKTRRFLKEFQWKDLKESRLLIKELSKNFT